MDKLMSPDPEVAALAARFEILPGQGHLFSRWPEAGVDDDKKCALLRQLEQLDGSYPGGLAAYIASARKLLDESKRGANSLAGWKPSAPDVPFYDLEPGTAAYDDYERTGLAAAMAGQVGFVVPAGGLGERLGYHGVKFALPDDTCSGECILGKYCGYISELQRLASAAGTPVRMPIAIMVSDDTETQIRALIKCRACFGLKESQFIFLKQQKVAALSDSDAALALSGDGYTIATKPHGHGDVHFLLHSSGVAKRWHEQGVRWLHFFQDTNTPYFANFLVTLGVSIKHRIAVNFTSVRRKAKQAVGSLCRLTHDDGRTMVCCVEYNQLEPLLISSGRSAGDVNEADGWSCFPGTINQIMMDLTMWLANIEVTGGAIDEFINPKYTGSDRQSFKSPTRLECMMQDYVKTMPTGHSIAGTRYPREYEYSGCKNDIVTAATLSALGVPPMSASTAEMALYRMHASQLAVLGADIGAPSQRSFRGVQVDVSPAIMLMPSFSPCFCLLKEKLLSPSSVRISSRSSLVIRGSAVVIESLVLDGALEIDVVDGGSLHIASLTVQNRGWTFEELDDASMQVAPQEIAIRGFALIKAETRSIKIDSGQNVVINE